MLSRAWLAVIEATPVDEREKVIAMLAVPDDMRDVIARADEVVRMFGGPR